ncbi:uncharacterized protein LOC143052859 [Mytilus galloprovincialis]|uniref:uncharacterized protein LOC143052859 n=1 Tax=Mytilus galloprovincialis TaxID=29158 RepID=UPI003F7CA74B
MFKRKVPLTTFESNNENISKVPLSNIFAVNETLNVTLDIHIRNFDLTKTIELSDTIKIAEYNPVAVGMICMGILVVVFLIFAWWFLKTKSSETFDTTYTISEFPKNNQKQSSHVRGQHESESSFRLLNETNIQVSEKKLNI